MAAVVTYDVDARHVEVKNAMKEKGYSDFWTHNGQSYNLPNTTLYKPTATAATALADIKAVAAAYRVRLERALALDVGNWDAIPGDPHAR
ncbi:hypothetical protein [Anaeromyxobacter sp. PSR-1]|uniref:hypothetical protein n=1 Tax=Anaeromyxobacter sp. PSR-1 TaxID=1300915 RepID=UPI0005E58EBB|nr:hypothetical protein [Anaeromyxobacter sp. PSR-1]GAO01832.1 hypothetical protein PSR1_00693 [Anaeromyxobacter sp. PSR-1]